MNEKRMTPEALEERRREIRRSQEERKQWRRRTRWMSRLEDDRTHDESGGFSRISDDEDQDASTRMPRKRGTRDEPFRRFSGKRVAVGGNRGSHGAS